MLCLHIASIKKGEGKMALNVEHYISTIQFVDKGGNFSTRSYRHRQLDTSGDISALITAQSGLVAALQAVSDCSVKQVTLSRVQTNDANPLLPTADTAEVEMQALITARITGHPNKSASLSIPGPKNGIFVASSGKNYNIVDMADADVITFMSLFAGTTPDFLVSDGETIVNSGAAGKRVHSRSVRG